MVIERIPIPTIQPFPAHPKTPQLTPLSPPRFYVNTYTKKSHWDKPTEPARPPQADGAPGGPPPTYSPGDSSHNPATGDTKVNPYDNHNNGSNSPYINHNTKPGSTHTTEDEDARLARQLQAEEDARARSVGGGASPYGQQPQYQQQQGGHSPFPGQLPPRPDTLDRGKSGGSGFLGKLLVKKTGAGGSSGGGLGGIMGGHQQQHYGGYPPQQQQYGGYPQQQQQ
jgi:hypothetical protein